MALSVTVRLCVLAAAFAYISLGTAYNEEDVPYEGGAAGGGGGVGAGGGGGGGVGAGGGGSSGGGGGVGVPDEIGAAGAGGDPAQIVAKALLCFNDKYIYSSCEEEYRLTESGNLNVSPDHTDEYCSGPCLSETHLVLDCIDNILAHFLFYNRATIRDVRDTIQAGCGYGPERGNFDVSQHIEAEEGSGSKVTNQLLIIPLVVMIIGRVLLH